MTERGTDSDRSPRLPRRQPLKTYRGYSEREDAMGLLVVTVQTWSELGITYLQFPALAHFR